MSRDWYQQESRRLIEEHAPTALGVLMEEALVAYPDDPEFNYRYAVALSGTDPAAAWSHAQRAADLANEDPGILTRCAVLMCDIGMFVEAKTFADRVAPLVDRNFPLLADFFHVVGLLGFEKGNDAVAEQYLGVAFEVDPVANGHARRYAEYLAGQGRHAEALRVVDVGIKGEAQDKEALLSLRAALAQA